MLRQTNIIGPRQIFCEMWIRTRYFHTLDNEGRCYEMRRHRSRLSREIFSPPSDGFVQERRPRVWYSRELLLDCSSDIVIARNTEYYMNLLIYIVLIHTHAHNITIVNVQESSGISPQTAKSMYCATHCAAKSRCTYNIIMDT